MAERLSPAVRKGEGAAALTGGALFMYLGALSLIWPGAPILVGGALIARFGVRMLREAPKKK